MRFTLGSKIVILIIVVVVALTGVAMGVSYVVIGNMNNQLYTVRANELAATVARVVDARDAAKVRDDTLSVYRRAEGKVTSDEYGSEQFLAYVDNYSGVSDSAAYKHLMEQLRSLQDVNSVSCLYLAMVERHDEAFIYLLDASESDPCPTGCIDPIFDVNRKVLSDPSVGFPAYVTDMPEYGWLVTAGAPIYDEAGEVICYAFTDISMDAIKQQERSYVMLMAAGLTGITLLLSVSAILYVRKSVVGPLNELSDAATRYCAPGTDRRSTFEGLRIHTHDEIESLYKSMVQMEHSIDEYIENLVETREQLRDTRIEANHMNDLAHKDALTGVRNKLAYDQEIAALERELEKGPVDFGIVLIDLNDLKLTNDRYGHKRGDASIIALTRLVCGIYAHSPVFRIGGDEFVVLLRGQDYESRDALADAFRKQIAELREDKSGELPPWERISAALGYATYDPTVDESAVSVFRRADGRMYVAKKSMKGGTEPR